MTLHARLVDFGDFSLASEGRWRLPVTGDMSLDPWTRPASRPDVTDPDASALLTYRAAVEGGGAGAITLQSVATDVSAVDFIPSPFNKADEIAFISGVYPDGSLPFYAGAAWNDDNPATYTGGYTLTAKWGAPTAATSGGTVLFYFDPASTWNATEQRVFTSGFALWSAVSNISFGLTTDASQAQITIVRGNDDEAKASPRFTGGPSAGLTGGKVLYTMSRVEISIDTSTFGFGPIDGNFSTAGGYVMMTVLHEIGHAIGLQHAGPYNGTANAATQQFSAWDTRLWTIMSYLDPYDGANRYYGEDGFVNNVRWRDSGNRSVDPTGLMPLDILAAQALYGAPVTTPFSGGQVFGFNSNITGPTAPFFDFTQNRFPILSLWSAGQNNTLDLSGFGPGATVNLNPGTFSSVAGMTNNLAIADGTWINTLIATDSPDVITGNSGVDHIDGRAGQDQLTLDRSASANGVSFIFDPASGAESVLPDGTTFRNIEKLILTTGAGADVVTFRGPTAPTGDSQRWNGGGGADRAVIDWSGLGVSVMLQRTDANFTFGQIGSSQLYTPFIIFTNVESFHVATGRGDDVFASSAGDDLFNAGSGTDQVSFSGPHTQFNLYATTNGYQIVDMRAGSPDGTDLLIDVDTLVFTDGSFAISAIPLSQSPALNGLIGASYVEQASAVVLAQTLSIGASITAVSSASVAISAGYMAGDQLSFTSQNGITGSFNASTRILTLTGAASVSAYQAALASVAFASASDNPTNFGANPTRTLAFELNGQVSRTTLTVAAVDDAPTFTTLLAGTPEGSAVQSVLVPGGISISSLLDVTTDPDTVLSIVAVNGRADRVGQTFALDSGALLTINADGTFRFDATPLTYLPDDTSGASNSRIVEVFSYTVTGGYTGTFTMNVSGLDNDDRLLGTAGNDTLNGGLRGVNTVDYSSATAPVNVNLALGQATGASIGTDQLINIHNVLGGLAGDMLTGSAGVNVLSGGAGADILDGGAGDDQLYGGVGNDTYLVDSQSDLVFEEAGGGVDTIVASTSFYLYAQIEALQLSSDPAAQFGVGNDLANTLTGNQQNNLLLGGAGNDTVNAAAGHDSVFGEAGDDSLNGEAGVDYLVGGDGSDTLNGGADADALYGQNGDDMLTGGTGFFTDILVGGDGNDLLDGSSGQGDYDLMDGGAGADVYLVDTPDDLTFEASGGGIDTVRANIVGAGYYLYAEVENLILEGATPFGVGNALNNALTGNAIGNFLLGGAGDDVLNGKGGNDVLFGEAGADTFIFEHGTGGDVIGDFQTSLDRIDLTALGFASFAAVQANMVQNGNVGAIDLGGGDILVLHNVTMSTLTAADFIL